MQGKLALGSGAVVVLAFAVALLGPAIAPFPPLEQDLANNYAGVSFAHPLGTDDLGRDTLSRLIHGARFSLGISALAVSLGLVLGSISGVVAAYYGGLLDSAVMRLMDVLLALPGVLLAIAVVAVLGPGLLNTIAAVAVVAVPTFARIARGSALAVRQADYVLASRAVGASDARLILRHVMPNCLSPIVVQTTLMLGSAILIASGLSFLGLGVQPPHPEWGAMLSKGRELIRVTPVGAIAPGIAITLVVSSFGVLGDVLQDALQPRREHPKL